MSNDVFVVSEWLPKPGCDKKLFEAFQKLMATTKEQEPGCLRASATRQVSHPGSPTQSKFTIVLLQHYENVAAFDAHCGSPYVKEAGETLFELVEEWQCRLFHEPN